MAGGFILAVAMAAAAAGSAQPPAGWVFFESDAGDGSMPYAARQEAYSAAAALDGPGTTRISLFELRRSTGGEVVAEPSTFELKVIRIGESPGAALSVTQAACPRGEDCSGREGTLDLPLGRCADRGSCWRTYGMFNTPGARWVAPAAEDCRRAAAGAGARAQLDAAAAKAGAAVAEIESEKAAGKADFSGRDCPGSLGSPAAAEPPPEVAEIRSVPVTTAGFHASSIPSPRSESEAAAPSSSGSLPPLLGAAGGALLGLVLGGPVGALIGAALGLGVGWLLG